MLVLTRRRSESIIVGGNIEIIIVHISEKKVRLGINAPKDISINRKEVHEAIENTKRKNST